jgi:hypothetical protein
MMDSWIADLEAKVAGMTEGEWQEGIEGNLRAYGPDGRGDNSGFVCEVNRRCNLRGIVALRNNAERLLDVARKARALSDKLEAIHDDPRYQAVWMSYQVHGGNYLEPTYMNELDALRKALEAE